MFKAYNVQKRSQSTDRKKEIPNLFPWFQGNKMRKHLEAGQRLQKPGAGHGGQTMKVTRGSMGTCQEMDAQATVVMGAQ